MCFIFSDVSNRFEGILSFNHILNHFGGVERGVGLRDYMFWSKHMFSLFWMIQTNFKELSFDYFIRFRGGGEGGKGVGSGCSNVCFSYFFVD